MEYIDAVQQSGRLDIFDCIISNRICMYSRGEKKMNMKKKHMITVIVIRMMWYIFTLNYGEMWQIFKGQISLETNINPTNKTPKTKTNQI